MSYNSWFMPVITTASFVTQAILTNKVLEVMHHNTPTKKY